MVTISKIVMTTTILVYIVIASIGCSPMGVITCELLDTIGMDSQIGLADVEGKESYGHVFVILNGNPIEPRYLGLHLQNSINYDNPYETYESKDDYTNAGYTVFPSVNTIVKAIGESL